MYDELSTGIDRRELFRRVAAIAAATSLRPETAGAQQNTSPTSRFFPGFARSTVQTSGTTINVVKGGEGPPLLLLHGAPQSHLSWRLVAPQLAKETTVVATDLARLRRQRQAAGHRRPFQLLEAQHGPLIRSR